MSTQLILILLGLSSIVYGLIAGVFLTFSDFVMRSLATIDPLSGVRSMQVINQKVYGSTFLLLLLGMVPISIINAGIAYFKVDGAASLWLMAGTASYLIGVFFITMVCNVPMNKHLDSLDASVIETESYWKIYTSIWTHWNHVRTICSLVSSVCFLVACVLIIQP